MLFRNVEIDDSITNLRVTSGVVSEISSRLKPASGEQVLDAEGAALIRGLCDNHIHLCSYAAARDSLAITQLEDIEAADRTMPVGQSMRVVNYHEDVHGQLNKAILDVLAPGRIVRVQHQSGRAWYLSSAALTELGIDHSTGVFVGNEIETLKNFPSSDIDLAATSSELASFGVTSVTDATAYDEIRQMELLFSGIEEKKIRQRLTITGAPSIADLRINEELKLGPVKIIVGDHDLPSIENLVDAIKIAQRAGRGVAFHCVTRVALVLIIAAFNEVGPCSPELQNRIEHGAIIPDEFLKILKELHVVVVTQPGFIRSRGDRYLSTVDKSDQPFLYRCGSLASNGIGVYGSTDAPYGIADPWASMATAIDRLTESGQCVGVEEKVSSDFALAMFQNQPESKWRDSHGPHVGDAADLVLLSTKRQLGLVRPSADLVQATWIGGDLVFTRGIEIS